MKMIKVISCLTNLKNIQLLIYQFKIKLPVLFLYNTGDNLKRSKLPP